jgi:carbon storage regulator
MLVLSRRLNEKIVFPGTQISVQVVAIKPGTVRLGIDAPRTVTVLREEVPDRIAEWGPSPCQSPGLGKQADLRKANRMLRNRLRAGRADLQLLRRQLRLGLIQEAEETVDKMQHNFELLGH